MFRLSLVCLCLLFSVSSVFAGPKKKRNRKKAKETVEKVEKPKTETQKEWETLKYYRARFANDQKAHREERDQEIKIRLIQNLPLAPDGLPVYVKSSDSNDLSTAEETGTTSAVIEAVQSGVSPQDALKAEKKRLAEEKKAKDLEAAKAKLLGDQTDETGQVIDEDPFAKEDKNKKGRKKKKKDKKRRRGR